MAQGPINPGGAVSTGAGELPPPIRWVIHAATMGPDLMTSAELIGEATSSAMAAAAAVGATSIAYPALGTGVGGFPVRRAAMIMVEAVLDVGESTVERVVFVTRDSEAMMAFADAISHRR
jgi:O-acetyl-ADP-ribose deacetylase (regulator of RNase III)